MLELNRIYCGDCLDVMNDIRDGSVDSIVTDPPYGINFMGKKWDYDVPSVEIWRECLRVLKPGGYILSFAGTRTQHRMAVNIEDAGFEIRDMIAWVYGSGFPKSLNISKAIDKAAGLTREKITVGNPVKRMIPGADQDKTGSWIKDNGREYQSGIEIASSPKTQQWDGWGTALKPALEPITMARKPIKGTVAANVLKYGTGGINIDGCRVETSDGENRQRPPRTENKIYGGGKGVNITSSPHNDNGRFPANLIHDGSDEVLENFPDRPAGGSKTGNEPSEKTKDVWGKYDHQNAFQSFGDEGSAARFFFCAKASKKDRNGFNNHPTVKPLKLMKYLIKLVTPPKGVVLDPFAGSGSTCKAAIEEGFEFIGIEKEKDFAKISNKRILNAEPQLF